MSTLTMQEEEHLRLLALFHNVVAGLGVLFACFPLLHLGMGIMMVTGRFETGQSAQDMAAVMCAFAPFGTVLGVFTLLVLQRPAVKAAFAPNDSSRVAARA